MIKEIQAKSILIPSKSPSHWFGAKYIMNIYRGCEHRCIYCDSRSDCYKIEDFDNLEIKVNAIDLLKKEISRKRSKDTIGTGAMSDPYTISEKKYRLTEKALEVIADRGFPVHITTKSNLILRDIDIIQSISRIYASVAFTITSFDDDMSKKIEPFAPSATDRFNAMGILSTLGIVTGITLMPILPFIQDNEKNIVEIIKRAKDYGASYIYPCFGVTLRDRQREYFYKQLDEKFKGVRANYEKKFGDKYMCNVNNASKLKKVFYETCDKYNISTEMPSYKKELTSMQLSYLK